MSPLSLVGMSLLLTTTTLADVSHVISGSAQPPAHPLEINSAFQTKNPQDFWWMKDDSPLKASYDFYKKCSGKGNCGPIKNVEIIKTTGSAKSNANANAYFEPIDVDKNVFLNGQYSSNGGNAAVSASSSSSNSNVAAFHSGANLDLSNNPFLKAQVATAGNGEQIRNENGFLGVQPSVPFKGQIKKGFATTHPLANKKPFATTHPNQQQSIVLGQNGQACEGHGRICVAKESCVNGVASKQGLLQVGSNVQYCNAEKEVCCRLENSNEVNIPNLSGKTISPANINDLAYTAGKSSVPGSSIKFSGAAGLSPGQIQILSEHSLDERPQLNFIGESSSPSSTLKPARDLSSASNSISSTVDYSNVDFDSAVRFASSIQGPAYLPPVGSPVPPSRVPEIQVPTIVTYQPSIPTTPRPSCAPGQYLAPSGRCEDVRKPCPPGTRPTPSGACEQLRTPRPSCAPGQILSPSGQCIYQTSPAPKPQCGFGQILSPSGQCVNVQTPSPRPQCGPGQTLGVSGQCVYPTSPSPRPTPSPRPQCGLGQTLSPSGQCLNIQTPSPRPQCGPGQILGISGLCVYPTSPSPRPTPSPRPQCGIGQTISSSGQCVNIQTPSPRPQCGPGQILGISGECLYPSTPAPRPSCPSGSFPTASGGCQRPSSPQPSTRPSCPSGSYLGPSGNCERPQVPSTTPGYVYPKPCPAGTVKSPSGDCLRLTTPAPRPSCPFGTYPTPSGDCESPVTSPRPQPSPTTSREYLPPVKETPTPRPNPTPGYVYEKPTPTFSYPSSTLIPSSNVINNQYVRPTTSKPVYLPPNQETSGSNIKNDFLPPDRVRPDNTGSATNNTGVFSPPPTRPSQFVPEQNNEPPSGCAAALKCVQEIYCTADGSVSPVPVVLTKEQELLRAPTTTCKDEESGIIGKCCRDLNYKDPWPSANLVNGVDDGQYKEDDSIAQYKGI